MLNPKNIQEFVAQKVIQNVGFRDNEVENLKYKNERLISQLEILSNLIKNSYPNLIKCSKCNVFLYDADGPPEDWNDMKIPYLNCYGCEQGVICDDCIDELGGLTAEGALSCM